MPAPKYTIQQVEIILGDLIKAVDDLQRRLNILEKKVDRILHS